MASVIGFHGFPGFFWFIASGKMANPQSRGRKLRESNCKYRALLSIYIRTCWSISAFYVAVWLLNIPLRSRSINVKETWQRRISLNRASGKKQTIGHVTCTPLPSPSRYMINYSKPSCCITVTLLNIFLYRRSIHVEKRWQRRMSLNRASGEKADDRSCDLHSPLSK